MSSTTLGLVRLVESAKLSSLAPLLIDGILPRQLSGHVFLECRTKWYIAFDLITIQETTFIAVFSEAGESLDVGIGGDLNGPGDVFTSCNVGNVELIVGDQELELPA